MINNEDFPCISSEFSRLVSKSGYELRQITYDYRMACITEGRKKIGIMLEEIQPLRNRLLEPNDQLSLFYIVQDNLYLLQEILNEFDKTLNNKAI